MTNYQKIRNGRDILTSKGRFRCTHDSKSLHVGLPKSDDSLKNGMIGYGEYCDFVWSKAEEAVSGMGEIEMPAKNIGADETIAFGYSYKLDTKITNWLIEKYGREHIETIKTTFVPYMKNSIYNLLRLDVALNHKNSPYQRTLFGSMRTLMLEVMINAVVTLAVYGLAGNETIAGWLVNPDKIKEYFPQVPDNLRKIDDDGKEYIKGRSTGSLDGFGSKYTNF